MGAELDAMAEGAAATTIIERLDGLPLALELAAASALTLNLSEIAQQLDRRFDLLTRGSRTAVDRQKTLWAAIDWSYDLLSDLERLVFCRLSVFPAEFDHDAASGVCSEDDLDVPRMLEALVTKSLVARTSSGRLRLLESIRAYARERLDEGGEADRVAERHARWFASALLGSEVRPSLGAGSDALDAVYDDLTVGLHWAADHDGELALDVLVALQPFWLSRGRWSEGRSHARHVLDATMHLETAARQTALARDSGLALVQGDAAAARTRVQEAADLAGRIGGEDARRVLLGNLGAVATREGEYDTAEELYTQALAEATGRDGAICRVHLGELARRRGDLDLAWECANEALVGAKDAGDAELTAKVLNLLADIAHQRDDRVTARRLYEDTLEAARATNDRTHITYLLYGLGKVAIDDGAKDEAAALLAEAVDLGQELDSRDDLVESLEATARWVTCFGTAFAAAARLVGAVDAARAAIGFPRPEAERAAHDELVAELERRLGRESLAVEFAAGAGGSLDSAAAEALGLLRG